MFKTTFGLCLFASTIQLLPPSQTLNNHSNDLSAQITLHKDSVACWLLD